MEDLFGTSLVVLVGGVIAEYTRPMIVRYYQQAGFDFIFIENEHMFFDPTHLVDTVQSARDNGLPVIAKPPTLERGELAKMMEAGIRQARIAEVQFPELWQQGQMDQAIVGDPTTGQVELGDVIATT